MYSVRAIPQKQQQKNNKKDWGVGIMGVLIFFLVNFLGASPSSVNPRRDHQLPKRGGK
jgi:hypothetical protein